MTTFMIVPLTAPSRSTPVNATPIEGRWYCGHTVEHYDNESFAVDGALGKCEDGAFYDEDGEEVDMGDYDYLVEQH